MLVSIFNLLAILGRLSPDYLGMGVAEYDPVENYDDVRYQLIGF
jgi:hypothetical protein